VTWQVSGADRPAVAQARADELREVLLNVLENARLAGARCVAVELVREATEVRIDVRDDGHGMPPEVLARAFEPHFSTRTSGSGLGLAISRRMVEGWGGSMTVESQPGRGTLLRIGLAAA
jgi:signal transduction histidine kinase